MSSSRQCNTKPHSHFSRTLCNCCDKYLCLERFKIHADQPNEELTPISDEFKELFEELNNISLLETSFIKQLDQWRFKAHQHIEEFYQKKSEEYESLIQQIKEREENQLKKIRHQLEQLIYQQETTEENISSLNNNLQSIREQINLIKTPQFIFSPLIIDNNLIQILNEVPSKNLFPISSPCQTIKSEDVSWFSIATNQEHILISQSYKLCLLNHQMKIEKEIKWKFHRIWDMFFSSTIDRFIILTERDIFNLDEKTMILTKYPLLNNDLKNRKWYSGTIHNQTLFLSINMESCSLVFEYTMFPSIEFVKEWHPPVLCDENEFIHDLKSNNNFLALVISNKRKNEMRLELRLPTTFEQQWTINITELSTKYRIRCSSLLHNQWLIIDAMNSRLLHIDTDGTLIKEEKYHPSPRHAVQIYKHLILISTIESFNLHQLS